MLGIVQERRCLLKAIDNRTGRIFEHLLGRDTFLRYIVEGSSNEREAGDDLDLKLYNYYLKH